MSKSSAIVNFVGQLPRNLFSGFVVSLIALPLALGLAIASEAPPIAGIISAIVGGSIVAIFGGSHLTITGPGNGLVIVVLSAITTLGNGDLKAGYLITLAAIIFSGVLMFLFGLFRLGALSEFFPASALQGMLAAIGVGILAKQFHVMLGDTLVGGNTIEQLAQIPESVLKFFNEQPFAGILGLGSLIFLFLYSKIRNSYFHLIPAPMWVVLIAIGTSYYYLLVVGVPAPINDSLLIQFPDNLIADLPKPDFSKLNTGAFWSVVISLTLIASIETLLSIKAVDKLDPKKRRSNVNKDLRAIGVASVLSGFLGGLNVVTVIARSSVNANNGGSNRSANFFHALFLVLFLLLFSQQIALIPLTALAAILVYTGYKLSTPENLFRIYKIGREQALIFLTTLIATLITNLISGIVLGMLSTLLIHILINKSFFLFSRNVFKPNVLMYQEEESKNYYVSVKNFCSFLNLFKLRAKLDEIPENHHAIIDFSLCEFVDHTAMESLNDYQRTFAKRGGLFEIIGLDIHASKTDHPFAVKKSRPIESLIHLPQVLTRRQSQLQKLGDDLGWEYLPDFVTQPAAIEDFLFFDSHVLNYQYNSLARDDQKMLLFDLNYSEGAFIAKEDIKATFLYIKIDRTLPSFLLDKENFYSNLYSWIGEKKDIDFKEFPDFSRNFHLSGKNPKEIQKLFSKKLVFFFESHNIYHLECNGSGLLIKGKDRLLSIQEIKRMLAYGNDLVQLLEQS